MKTNYFKQAWHSLKSQPVVSLVSVTGTALAIFLIMVVVMLGEVETKPFAPESNRDRWLVQRWASITNTEWGQDNSSNGPMGYKAVKETFYKMTVPEAVTAFACQPNTAPLSVPGRDDFSGQVLEVDGGFWQVMDFTFIAGKPFSQQEFDAAQCLAVISESTARRLFGSTDVVGREFSVYHVPYRVSGVVRDVSNLARFAYADAWIPFTTTNTVSMDWCEYMGGLSAIILARDPADFPAIREEYDSVFARLGEEAALGGWKFIQRGRPYTQEVDVNTSGANVDPDMDAVHLQQFIVYLILLIVPAVNLSSMTHSRLRSRSEEIGIRRAFGARRGNIVADIFIENLIVTVVAGIVGLLLSLALGLIWGSSLFPIEAMRIDLGMLFHWSTFGWAMLFCFILNLLSTGIPAIHASRINIVSALTNK